MMPRFSHAIAWAVYEHTSDPQARNAAAREIQSLGWPQTESYVVRALRFAGGTARSLRSSIEAVVNGEEVK